MVTISTAQKFQILYLNFKCLKCIVTTVSLLMLIKIRCNRKSQIFAKTAVIRKFVKRALCAVTYERIKSFIECFIYTSNIQH